MHTQSAIIAAVGIAASPTIWNIIAQNEYRKHTLERILGSKYRGCYALAAWIFFSSLYRDYLFQIAVDKNAGHAIIPSSVKNSEFLIGVMKKAGVAVMGAGMTLVCSAYYRLGVTGTYLGDYFGILMKERVTAFPFSHFNDPMYLGSTMSFLAIAMMQNSSVGVALSAWVHLVYWVSTNHYEGPFTTKIYQEAAAAAKEKKTE